MTTQPPPPQSPTTQTPATQTPDPAQLASRGPFPPSEGELDRALALVRYLRNHCPWDAEQTQASLAPHLLEEAHEVVEAIEGGDPSAIEAELGDLLLNLAFQIVVGEESGDITRRGVRRALEAKMIRRHPHLFGDGERERWEVLKAREREASGGGGGVLDGLPLSLDPLLRSYRIQERVSGVGFDWEDPMGALAKVREEVEEVAAALAPGGGTLPSADLREELGDLLFAVVNLTRLARVHPSTALGEANRKFTRRFASVEALARERGIPIPGSSLELLDQLWDEVKASERSPRKEDGPSEPGGTAELG